MSNSLSVKFRDVANSPANPVPELHPLTTIGLKSFKNPII